MASFSPKTVLSALVALSFATNSTVQAESVSDLIARGNMHYDRLQPAEALKFYLPAEKLDPRNVDLLVRISRQYRHLMSDARAAAEKIRLGRTAVAYADRAVKAGPADSEAHLAVAISYGKLVPLVGNKERLAASPVIRSAAEKVLKLDPQNDLAWQILGRWYLNIAEVSGMKRALASMVYGKLPPATFQDAARCFEKAIALNPSRLMHYIELGRTYIHMGREEEARNLIQKGLGMQNTEKDDPESKARGRELLAKLR